MLMKKHLLLKFYLILFVISVFAGCVENSLQETIYSRNEISFNCPLGWTLDEGLNENNSSAVSCENDFSDSGGSFNLGIISGKLDLNVPLEITKSTTEKLFNEKLGTVKFGITIETRFNGMEANAVDYNGTLLGGELQGNIMTFNCKNNTIIATFQETVQDHSKNIYGFQKIKETIKCG